MKVLHLISSGGMYGAEAVILELCAEAADGASAGIGVFCSPSSIPALFRVAQEKGIEVHCVECRGQLDKAVPARMRELAAITGCDVVHTHGYKADLYALVAFRGPDRPALVSTCHTWYDNDLALRVYGIADRWALRHFDEVVSVSSQVSQQLAHAGVCSNRVSLIGNGVQTDRFRAVQERRRTRPDNSFCVGLVGRLAEEKGVDVFLRSISRLVARFPSTRFVVAGDGPQRSSLEQLRSALGLDHVVQFLGAVTDMDAMYAELDLLVSASRDEGLPMVLLEGMASGLPVVATTVGEVPTLVEERQTGFLVPPNDPAALAEAMAALLQASPLREFFGRNGAQRIEEHYSAAKMAASYEHVYRRAVRRRRKLPATAAPGTRLA